ncbi:hypothetical protein FLONG3_2553 [Fusarium longipes]|uniref:DUF218 domain-containing protein n=1 Tax=Fusarium longipes TaxID=694270 RepID=A0A395T3L0_9HYPO|nr:hypothetical protein FLONG3_2553 [Fusarium longipes]
MPSAISEESKGLFTSANIVSRFLAFEQIYSPKELGKYVQTLQKQDSNGTDSRTTDVIVLCASAILAIPEAVFTWAVQQQTSFETGKGNIVLVLCGGIGPCTPFVYDAIKASKKYAPIFKDIEGKPEGQVLKTMAERCYKLKINDNSGKLKYDGGFTILVSDRSTDCGADASEVRNVLDDHGISPRSVTVVQDPAMSSRTVSSFESVYNDQRASISSWPPTRSDLDNHQEEPQDCNNSMIYKELWSMDRLLDRVMGDTAHTQHVSGKRMVNGRRVPDEVENAWSTIMEKNSLRVSC